jgi:hypothetical protein
MIRKDIYFTIYGSFLKMFWDQVVQISETHGISEA